jgi:hypothetical protein
MLLNMHKPCWLRILQPPARARCFLLALAMISGGHPSFTSAETAHRDAPLRISSNHRFLIHVDGRPFFYLGDTAWELFQRLNREEADRFLEDHARQGFTVIQAVLLAELDGLKTPNAHGDVPFLTDGPTQPNEAYFKHIDYIVGKVASLGLAIGLLRTCGDKVGIYGQYFFNEENARADGRFLGRRYRDQPIIWILGGDHPADVTKTEGMAGKMIRGWWFNPRDGLARTPGEFPQQKRVEFSPPTKSTTDDWILVLDDAARNYPAPGVANEQRRDRR